MDDKIVEKLINSERARQESVINLIASENYVSRDVLSALGSVLTNKYSEGYPRARYYGGNGVIDEIEELAKRRALELFGLDKSAWSVNVQPYSGSPANFAAYAALVPAGEAIMGLALSMGGHLTHGHAVSQTGKLWRAVRYELDRKTELLDYDVLGEIAEENKPKLIVCGFTAYSRVIDFAKFRKIADGCGALLMVDMSHFSGLVAGGAYPAPFEFADVVTSTTHKTLRGPRAAAIFSKKEFSAAIDKAVFPGLQGGPHMNQIAAMAVAFNEASGEKFGKYAARVVANAKKLAGLLAGAGWRIVSGGTDSHLFLVDTVSGGISGKGASDILERAGIIVNMNTIPFDSRKPNDPSGIRIGTAAITTRGICADEDMEKIAAWIDGVLKNKLDPKSVAREIKNYTANFPLP